MRIKSRRSIFEELGQEWTMLKRFIANRIEIFSKDYDNNLEIYCNVVSYKDLSQIIQDNILCITPDDSEKRGVSGLAESLEEAERYSDTDIIYNELRDFNRHTNNTYKWLILNKLQKILRKDQNGKFPIPQIVFTLGEKYSLSNEELQIISIHFLTEEWNIFHQKMRSESISDSLKNISSLCCLTTNRYAELIGINNNLQKKGLIHYQSRFNSSGTIELNPSLIFAINSNDLNLMNSGLFREERKAIYTPDKFSIPQVELEFLINTLKSGGSVLLSGESGIGKTEFAYSIAEHINLFIKEVLTDSSFFSNNSMRSKSTLADRILMIRTASNIIQNKKEILLIDEADAILQSASGFFGFSGNDGSYDKGELNSLLEDIEIPAIWITNSIEKIPASALRRFAYVYEFPHPDMKVRNRMLKEKLNIGNNENLNDLVDSISRRYDLTPSAMERMVDVVNSVITNSTENKSFSDTVEKYLETASRGSLRHDFRKLPAVSKSFNPELSSASIPLNEIIERIQKRTELNKPSRLLFEGQPGGGKTQFSLYLASAIGKEAIIKKPSDLLSKWVGEAEQNINAMFRNAELSEAVLIIDEADALLSDRSMAQRSWELSQASEFLQGIQDFKGILIACTNRVDSLDPAIRRRFHQKITFGTLEKNMIKKALNHLFPDVCFTKKDLKIIENAPPLMMSDIANASEMLDTEDSLQADTVITEIIENAKNRDMSKSIGF